MKKAYILLGSNLGDRQAHLRFAREYISRHIGSVAAASGIYETEPWGNTAQPLFLNQAVEVQTVLSPQSLLVVLKNMEKQAGRKEHAVGWPPRELDADILLMEGTVVQTPELTIPHPRMAERQFALQPLNDLAPSLIHPLTGKTIEAMLRECSDPGRVMPWKSPSI